MAEGSICRKCFHSYVCEQFNEHRDSDWDNKKCHFANDHFVPTSDVAEVKHGHWITQEEAEALDRYDLAFCCSACCECNWDCTESESFNYCPNCGAKMDGKDINVPTIDGKRRETK